MASTKMLLLCVDGAKRDRILWTGDFAHTARTIAATTHRLDFVTGMIEIRLRGS